MGKPEIVQQSQHRRQNRFLLLLLIGATLLSVAKDVIRLHDFTNDFLALASSLHQTVNAALPAPRDASCPEGLVETDNSAQPFHWNGRVAPDQLLRPEVAVGGYLEVALQSANLAESIAESGACEQARVAMPARESGLSNKPHAARHSWFRLANQRVARNLGKPTVLPALDKGTQVELLEQVPAAIAVLAQITDGQSWLQNDLPSNPDCPVTISEAKSVNHRVRIANGYARTSVRVSSADVPVPGCAQTIRLQAARGLISLHLLQLLRASMANETFNTETLPDAPRTLRRVLVRAVATTPVAEESH
jgi:hypothetical protein